MKLMLPVSPRTATRALLLFSVFLLTASMSVGCWMLFGKADDYWIFTRIFDFNVKNNLPHAYKSILLFFSAVLLFVIARERKQSGGEYLFRWRALGWIFLALSVDEEIQIHQQFVSPLVAMIIGVNGDESTNSKVYWLVPYLAFTAVFCLAYLPFWWRLAKPVRFLFAVGGVVYVGGAAIVEEIAHIYSKTHPDSDLPYLFLTNISEWMQMLGTIIFIRALVLYLAIHVEETIVQWKRVDSST